MSVNSWIKALVDAIRAAVVRRQTNADRPTTTEADDRAYVQNLYRVVLQREPAETEIAHWVAILRRGGSDREVFNRILTSGEYKARNKILPGHPIGHYYSPIVDPDEARKYARIDYGISPEKILGVRISLSEMQEVWGRLSAFVKSSDFPMNKESRCRYYAINEIFPIGDAAILRAMILLNKPRRIIEIGSGFSSACMLDTLDEAQMADTRLTFIEPDPQRLRELLRRSDTKRCTLIEKPVQAVDPRIFEELQQNDILFIDSTHVMKTGSDVNFELFQALPRLRQGVLIHFHDIQYPFEYPNEWVYNRKYSWNEIYGLRAFLMYNSDFAIEFFNSLFIGRHRDLIEKTYAPILKNPGASIWIRKLRQ